MIDTIPFRMLATAACVVVVVAASASAGSPQDAATGMQDAHDGNREVEAGDRDETIAELDAGARLDPRDPDVYFRRGVLKYESADVAGARADLRRSLRIRPRFAPAHYHLGRIHRDRNAHAAAIAQFDRCLDLDPAMVDAWLDRGITKRRMGDHDGALADFDETIRRAPERGDTWFERAMIRYDRGEFDLAVNDLRRRCELEPGRQDDARLLIWLARAAGGDVDDASAELSRYVDEERATPNNDWTATIAGYLLGRVEEAALLDLAKEGDDSDVVRARQCASFFYLGARRMIDGDAAGAATAWRRCVATDHVDSIEHECANAALARYEEQTAGRSKTSSRRAVAESVATGSDAEPGDER